MPDMNKLTKPVFRLRLWWSRPLKCVLGFHKFDWNEWSYPMCGGLVSFHCADCQKTIKKIPLDDLPPTNCEHILDVLKEIQPPEKGK